MKQQPELHIGAVIDGDIVAGQHGGQWLLVAPASKRIIAKWGVCPDGYSLPTLEELDVIWRYREAIDAVDVSGGDGMLGRIAASNDMENAWGCIWSSAEYSRFHAWSQRFSDGDQDYHDKCGEYWVVPVRRIPAEAVDAAPAAPVAQRCRDWELNHAMLRDELGIERQSVAALRKERDHLLAEVETLRKDAERYRWLRNHEATCSWEEGDTEVCNHPGLLDEAVDESIAKAKGGEA